MNMKKVALFTVLASSGLAFAAESAATYVNKIERTASGVKLTLHPPVFGSAATWTLVENETDTSTVQMLPIALEALTHGKLVTITSIASCAGTSTCTSSTRQAEAISILRSAQ